eukprot:1157652-Pelagomonas_calceolata.AAC.19
MLGTCEVPPDFQEWGVPESPEKPNSVKCILGKRSGCSRLKRPCALGVQFHANVDTRAVNSPTVCKCMPSIGIERDSGKKGHHPLFPPGAHLAC